jgi:2-hydroxychromene-2-carboxylate isomerase
MAQPQIEILFDYASPYAYFGSLRVEGIASRHGATIVWTPVVLGGIFQAVGTTSPMLSSTARSRYVLEDLQNLADCYGVPYRPRTDFFVKSILPLRATLLIAQGAERARAVHAFYAGAWAQDLDLSDPGVVARVLDQAGFAGAKLVEGTQQQAIKDELKRNTNGAIARGVFGTPTFFVNSGKMFWGHDRLELVDHHLRQVKAS